MTDARFELCLPFILKEEGGNDDDPHDHGGRTSRGVIQREYDAWRKAKGLPTRDVWTADTSEIHDIYRERYWEPRCPNLHPGVDLSYFNICVNAGPGRADKILSASIGGTDHQTVDRFNDHVVSFYQGLAQFPRYGKGWLARSARIYAAAVKMVSAPVVTPQPPATPPSTPPRKDIPVSNPATGSIPVIPFDQIESGIETVEKFLPALNGFGFIPAGVQNVLKFLPILELNLKLASAVQRLDGDAETKEMARQARLWADRLDPPPMAAVDVQGRSQ